MTVKSVLYLLSLQPTVTPFFAFVLQNEGNDLVAKSLVCTAGVIEPQLVKSAKQCQYPCPGQGFWSSFAERLNQKSCSVCGAGWAQVVLKADGAILYQVMLSQKKQPTIQQTIEK